MVSSCNTLVGGTISNGHVYQQGHDMYPIFTKGNSFVGKITQCINRLSAGMDSELSVYKREGEREVAATSTACSVPYSNKHFTMEFESKERKQRSYNTFLTAFVAVAFTVALLEGVGLIFFYTHFQSTNTALETRIAAIEARELAVSGLEVSSEASTSETPATNAELRAMLRTFRPAPLLICMHTTLIQTILIHSCSM